MLRITSKENGLLEVPFHYAEDICQCGRKNTPAPHCRNCGSANGYGVSTVSEYIPLVFCDEDKKIFIPITDEDKNNKIPAVAIMIAKGFRCRRCMTYYHEAMTCKAPKIEPKKEYKTKKQQQLAKEADEFMAQFPRVKTEAEKMEMLALVAEMRLNKMRPLAPGKQRILDYYKGLVPTREMPDANVSLNHCETIKEVPVTPSASDLAVRQIFRKPSADANKTPNTNNNASQPSNGETAATQASADAPADASADASAGGDKTPSAGGDKTPNNSTDEVVDYKDKFDWDNNKL